MLGAVGSMGALKNILFLLAMLKSENIALYDFLFFHIKTISSQVLKKRGSFVMLLIGPLWQHVLPSSSPIFYLWLWQHGKSVKFCLSHCSFSQYWFHLPVDHSFYIGPHFYSCTVFCRKAHKFNWGGQKWSSLRESCQALDQSAKIIRCYITGCHILWGTEAIQLGSIALTLCEEKVINIITLFAAFWIQATPCDWMGCVCALKQNALPITANHSQLVFYLLQPDLKLPSLPLFSIIEHGPFNTSI